MPVLFEFLTVIIRKQIKKGHQQELSYNFLRKGMSHDGSTQMRLGYCTNGSESIHPLLKLLPKITFGNLIWFYQFEIRVFKWIVSALWTVPLFLLHCFYTFLRPWILEHLFFNSWIQSKQKITWLCQLYLMVTINVER